MEYIRYHDMSKPLTKEGPFLLLIQYFEESEDFTEKENIHQYIVAPKLKTPRLSCVISRHYVWQVK